MDHEGNLHVAGPDNLFACLQAWSREAAMKRLIAGCIVLTP